MTINKTKFNVIKLIIAIKFTKVTKNKIKSSVLQKITSSTGYAAWATVLLFLYFHSRMGW